MYAQIKAELNRLETLAGIPLNSLTVSGPDACSILDNIEFNSTSNQGQAVLDFLKGLESLTTDNNSRISWTGNVYQDDYIKTPSLTLKDWEGKDFEFYFFYPRPKTSWKGYDQRMRGNHQA